MVLVWVVIIAGTGTETKFDLFCSSLEKKETDVDINRLKQMLTSVIVNFSEKILVLRNSTSAIHIKLKSKDSFGVQENLILLLGCAEGVEGSGGGNKCRDIYFFTFYHE